jgi:hypothetical protein
MGIWLIWFLVILAVIASKYYTARAVTEMNLRLSEREKHLAALRSESKVIQNSLAIATRNLAGARRRLEETRGLIERLKPELKELEELEEREMQVAKDLIAKTRDDQA